MYQTHRPTSSDYDCLYYSHATDRLKVSLIEELIPYCIRPTNGSLVDYDYATFEELEDDNESSSLSDRRV